MNIAELIRQSTIHKKDAVLLIAYILGKNKEHIIAHDDMQLTSRQIRKIKRLFQRRKSGEPIAYLAKQKEFYGRNFEVNKNVLIPRPETETIIEIVRDLKGEKSTIIDVGTGSGCIAITLKLENPDSNVVASDISKKALKTAEKNKRALGANIELVKSNLLNDIPKYTRYDIIIANLPYVDQNWQTGKEIEFEPKTALFATDNGLKIVKRLIGQVKAHLNPDGFLILELDPCQHANITNFAKSFGFSKFKTEDYIIVFKYK